MNFFSRTICKGFTQHFKMPRSLLKDRFCHSTPYLPKRFSTSQQSAGFTLIEVVVSLFIFVIIMTAMSQTFISSFSGYKNTRAVQRDAENAQFALNLMAKELRTSTIVSASGTQPSVKFYDYSQYICFEYVIAFNQLTVKKKLVDPLASSGDPFVDCDTMPSTAPLPIATAGTLTGRFIVIPSTKTPAKSVGKVTVSLEISEGPNHTARIQTTSSLRDYGYIGL